MVLVLNIVFDSFFAGRLVNLSVKAYPPSMSRSLDNLFDDSSDALRHVTR